MDTKIFLLTWVYCGKASEVKRGDVKLLQTHKMQLKKQSQYRQGYFEIRTPEGFKNKPILNRK